MSANDEAAALWEAIADTWTRHVRSGWDVYRDKLNSPAFFAMLPPVEGRHGLDIGCGEGENTRALARRGARMDAIDISPTFVRHAAAREADEPLGIRYAVADAQALPFADASFDFATGFMSLMDLPDCWTALREAHRVIRPGGFLQFSILHPCFAPPRRRVLRSAAGIAYAIEIGGYVDATPYIQEWQFSAAPQEERAASPMFRIYTSHHTLAEWLNVLTETGFTLERVNEPVIPAAEAARDLRLQDTRVAPLFLQIRVRR